VEAVEAATEARLLRRDEVPEMAFA
jgi:hypothetical protein